MSKSHGIMFHHFHDDRKHIKGQGSMDQNQFRSMLFWLKKNYNLLNAKDWYTKSIDNSLEIKDICLTFDDNLKCQFEIALPVLEELGLTAFWFIYTSPFEGINERLEVYRYFRFKNFEHINDFYRAFNNAIRTSKYNNLFYSKIQNFKPQEYLTEFPFYSIEDKIFRFTRDFILGVERYYEIMDTMIAQSGLDEGSLNELLWMNEKEIKYLHENNHVIGLHSHSHPTKMEHKSESEQKDEYSKCYNILTKIISQPPTTMSHPCNSYNLETLNILGNYNIDCAFRANMQDGYPSKLEYPRIDHAILMKQLNL